jgi:Leucine-rich repeat (LRR) protein
LALHTLENLPGWTGQLRLEIRHYSYEGRLLDSLGSVGAPVRKVLVLTEESAYQPFDNTGEELSGSNSLYHSILQAMPDSERIALNIHIGESARLQQLIRQYTVSRDALRELLVQHPDYKTAFDPTVMRLLGGGDGYRLMPKNTPTLQARAQTLFPDLSAPEMEAFVLRLQQHPRGPRAELSRLIADHERLIETLSPWSREIPTHIPDTQTPLSYEQHAIQRHNRYLFMIDLLDCWRQQWTLPESTLETVNFSFYRPIIGELPSLSADFRAVTMVTLEGNSATRGVHEFLGSFSGLRTLTLRNFNLGRLPNLLQSPQMESLILSDCSIVLSPENLTTLAGLHQLTKLDLYRNPLGQAPDVSSLPKLNFIDLSHTGITDLPLNLLTRPHLRTALLNDNMIEELPPALFTLQRSTQEGIDLGGNPLSIASRERLKQHFQQTHQDFGIFAIEPDIHRVQALYPNMDQEVASRFVYLLPGTLGEGRVVLSRLEAELVTLEGELSAWTADIPAVHPQSNQPFNAQQLLIEHSTRDHFKELVLSCWRRESELDDFNDLMQPTFELSMNTLIIGDLPTLSADFSHVSTVYLNSQSRLTTGVTRFLECFPKLKTINIRNFRLGDIPESIFRMGDLVSVNLPNCNITLTPQTVSNLAEMTRLNFLDLSNNPLGLAPDVSQMIDLTRLELKNCSLTELPAGLLQLKSLETADLSGNAITAIPHDILELPTEIAESINLRGNPISEESVQILIAYFRRTDIDFGVEAVIERAEMEVSTSEDSAPDE